MFDGSEIVEAIRDLRFTHVVWLPDSYLGQWESALQSCSDFDLLRVCREGEAWPLAAGLRLGGMRPLVMMQTTGLFESGDALRNVLFDLKIPLPAIIGARSWLVDDSNDSAKHFTLPVLDAWGVHYELIEKAEDKPKLVSQLGRSCDRDETQLVLIAEGRR